MYDFSRSHPDFSGVSGASFTNPDIVPSPYGSFLIASDTPELDTFSNWYRVAATLNQVFTEIVLVHLENALQPTNRCGVF